MFPLEASRALFTMILIDKAVAIMDLARLTNVILGDKREVTCKVNVSAQMISSE